MTTIRASCEYCTHNLTQVTSYQAAPHLPHTVYGVPSLRLSVTHMCGLSSLPQGMVGRLFMAARIWARSTASRSRVSSNRLRSVYGQDSTNTGWRAVGRASNVQVNGWAPEGYVTRSADRIAPDRNPRARCQHAPGYGQLKSPEQPGETDMSDHSNELEIVREAPQRKTRRAAKSSNSVNLPLLDDDRSLGPVLPAPVGHGLLVPADTKPRRSSRELLSGPTDPADPACWSWRRYNWTSGMDKRKGMRVLRRWHDGRCGICGLDADLVNDHDHGTGWVRGLLCNGCNQQEGRARDTDDTFARWRACPSAAVIGITLVYDSIVTGVALPQSEKTTGPLSLPEWAPKHLPWPPEPWMPLGPSDSDPVATMTRDELVSEVKRLRQQVADIRDLVSPGTPRDLLAEPA